VVYDDTAAFQARKLLRAAGAQHVFILRGGIQSWVTDVLNPTLPERALDAVRQTLRRGC
jgi:hypothetical protein